MTNPRVKRALPPADGPEPDVSTGTVVPYVPREMRGDEAISGELLEPGESGPEPTSTAGLPGYYRAIAPLEPFAVGAVVYLLDNEDGRVEILRGERTYRTDTAAFLTAFEPAPDGPAARAAEMVGLMTEIGSLSAQSAADLADLASYNPHIAADGAGAGLALVPTDSHSAIEAKRSLATIKNAAARLRTELASRQAEIKAFAEEQAIILRHQAAELATLLATASEAVWTINLYLGEGEQIERLAEGAPAPVETPITIRQLVLYMDEETAIAAERGGIDAFEIDAFDAWLTADPAHLAQVLPELKGLVALKPRRNAKDYNTGHAIAEALMNEQNRKTYFLLRNGANLYRFWTNYEVGSRLVPATDEFLSLFTEREYDHASGTYSTVHLEPGSAAFMKAEKRAEEGQRHYMRAALILQGLIDRTTIFAPLPGKVSVGDESSYAAGGPLAVILDADAMLSDGRERFRAWRDRINAQLAPGMRIVGRFNDYTHGLHQFRRDRHDGRGRGRGNERLSPSSAEPPSNEAIYTLDGRRDGGFVFRYERNEQRWDRYDGYTDYEQRASCVVKAGDEFILNFDAATAEEMRFYLTSRLDRKDYEFLFPTLRMAITMKEQEEADEAPFRLLLAGEIAKAHAVSVAEATEATDELVHWWKFKNRTHRALTDDDAKAIRMIVAEYGLRAGQASIREGRDHAAIVKMIQAAEPNVLLIAHKSGPDYVALVPANAESLFVHEQVWRATSRREVREWRLLDGRMLRWQTLYARPAIDDYPRNVNRAEVLSDPEREAVIGAGWAKIVAKPNRRRSRWGWGLDQTEPAIHPAVPLTAAVRRSGKIELFFADGPAIIPTEDLLTSHHDGPDLGRGEVKWRRDASRAPLVSYVTEQHLSSEGRLPWQVQYNSRPYEGIVWWSDSSAIAAFVAERDRYAAFVRTRRALEHEVQTRLSAFDAAFATITEQAAYAKFLSDFNDPDLWEGHAKTLKLPRHLPSEARGPLTSALKRLIERGQPTAGLSAAEIVAAAATLSDAPVPEIDASVAHLRLPTD